MQEVDDDRLGVLVGNEVATRRRAGGMSMRELAARAGISQPFLSQIERGASMPSMTTVYRLARALGATPGDLLPVPEREVTVVRAGEGRRLPITESSAHTGIRALLLTDSSSLTVLEYTLTGDDVIDEWYQTAGESGLFVLEGSVAVHIQAGSTFKLMKDDFIHLPAGTFDRWSLLGSTPARVLFAFSATRS
ncbi:helix-turn-helix domain-containing protein [Streptomyces sp. NPDC058045]|uniref:helix-turn-helix domain-containing protein n=1 Tax=Streptomyces sp. NPDC058045 TaxID=3346311 RepID=UPI0036E2E716